MTKEGTAMATKDFDYKQFLLEKGERVGLYTAAGIFVLLVVLYLFWPGHGIFSPSPAKSATEIKSTADQKDKLITTNTPSESERVELAKVDPRLMQQAT